MTPKLEEVRDFEWTPYFELHLLHAMGGFKVLGIHQHFMKAVIYEKFCLAIASSAVPSDIVFKKIESYYNLDQGNKMFKGIPMGGTEDGEFSLTDDCLSFHLSRSIADNMDDENSMGSKSEGSSSIASDSSIRKEKGAKMLKKEVRKSSPAVERRAAQAEKRKSTSSSEGKKEDTKKVMAKKRQSGGERKSERSSRH